MTHRNHVRPTARVWAGLAATAIAITAIATATTASAAALPVVRTKAEGAAALASIADHVATRGGHTPATSSNEHLGVGFAEQFPESQVTFSDPLFDTAFPEADIFGVSGLMNASGVTAFGVGVDLWTDPFSFDWEYGTTGPLWFVDVDGDDDFEYYTGIVNVAGSVGGVLLDGAGLFVCDVVVDWDAGYSTYAVGFATSCLGANVSQIRMRAAFLYDDVSFGYYDIDYTPDFGWSGPILNDAYVSPVTPVTPPTPAPGPGTGELVTVLPHRLYDSRSGAGVRPAGSVTEVQVIGLGGVPTAAATALLNLTAVAPADSGFMTVFPCGQAVPEASNLNFTAGQTIPNAAVVKLDASGRVCVFTSAASGLLVDVNGYTPASSNVTPLDPSRLYDSRSSDGQRPAGTITAIQVAGRGGVATDAATALMNVTAVSAAADGYMTVFPCGTPVPDASNLNYRAGQTIANTVLGRVGTGGQVCVFTSAAAGLLVDVNASVSAAPGLAAVDPVRLYDTRTGPGLLAAGSITQVVVAGRGGVAAGATTAMLNVTVITAQGSGFATVFPCGASLPQASNLNFNTGETIPNAVVAKIGEGGAVCVYTSAPAGLLVDVNGYAT